MLLFCYSLFTVTLLSTDLVYVKFVRNMYSVMYHRRLCTVGLKTAWTRLRSGRSRVRFPAVARDFSLLFACFGCINTLMCTVWDVDRYKITFKLVINWTNEILKHIVVSSGLSRPGG